MLEVVGKSEWSEEQQLTEGALLSGDSTPLERTASDFLPLRDGANAVDAEAPPLSDDKRLVRWPSVANRR